MIPYPVAILAGGLSTRLSSLTKDTPKAMLNVAGMPFIDWQLDMLKSKGITKAVICTGHLKSKIEEHMKGKSDPDLSVSFSNDGDELLGTGGAIKKALPLLGDLFFVMYGDSYLDADFEAISHFFNEHDAAALITVLRNKGRWDKSNIIFEDGRIIKYDKRHPDERMEYIDWGLSLLKKECFGPFKDMSLFDLGEVFARTIMEKHVAGFEVKQRFYEIGSIAGLKETEKFLLKKEGNNGKFYRQLS